MPRTRPDESRCETCGSGPAMIVLGGVLLCDRCFDRRIAQSTGYPELPDPPPPAKLRGADGRSHRFRYRLWRAPTGVVADAVELGVEALDGYHAKVIGPHDADIATLQTRLDAQLHRKLRRLDLEDGPNGPVMSGMTLSGRLEWSDQSAAYDVIVDGQRFSWDQFGWMLEPFEGYEFEVRIADMEVVGDLGLGDDHEDDRRDDRVDAPRLH